MAYTPKHRLLQLTKAALGNRPVRITYEAENPCPGIAGKERIIEIRRIHPSEDGNILVRSWCRTCGKEENFRLDRITAHRTLRSDPVDPHKPVTAYLTIQRGRIPADDLSAVYVPQPTCGGLLAAARERIAEADRFRALFGDPESYPRRSRPVTCDDLFREMRYNIATAHFRALFGDPETYPNRTRRHVLEDHMRKVRKNIHTAENFRAVFGDPENFPRRSRPLTCDDLLRETRRRISTAEMFHQMTSHLTSDLAEIHA